MSDKHVPRYLRQREKSRSDRAYTWLNGKKIKLGIWNSKDSKLKYTALLDGLQENRFPPKSEEQHDPTISELMAGYLDFATIHYGRDSAMMHHIRSFMRGLRQFYSDLPVDDFRAKRLKELRKYWIDQGWTRKYINEHVARLKRMFKWGVSEEMVLPETLLSLQSVVALRSGKTEAHDKPPIEPVSDADVERTLPFLPELVACMVMVQRLCGCRPGELVRIRKRDIDRSGAVWVCHLAEHKSAHRGKRRDIYFGPRCQKCILPRLVCGDDDRIFPMRRDSYRRAIARACERAKIPTWTPLQLRHSAGTKARELAGLEGAQLLLGHSRCDVTQIYAETSRERAIELASRIG